MPPIYTRWLNETLRLLAELPHPGNPGIEASENAAALWSRWDRLKSELQPELNAHVRLVETALRALPQILSGTLPATSVLFPSGSFELVEPVYRDNPISDHFNELLSQPLVAYVRESARTDPSRRIRILEIGAGTGATTDSILRSLAPFEATIEEYCFTDLSKTFLTQARRRYASSARYTRFKIFDVEKHPCEQGFEQGAYDVVLAVNVLHATEDIRQTLRNAKACLKKHGLLLLNELSRSDLFYHLTFGLLEGWWRFQDEWRRIPGSPVLSPQQWKQSLAAEGFLDISFPAASTHDLGHQIIAASSNGWIRSPQRVRGAIAG